MTSERGVVRSERRLKVLIADDHDLVREMIASFLENVGGMAVTAVGTLDEALARLPGDDDPYDVILLDYAMPGMNGLEGLAEAIERSGGRPVALMSGTASRNVAEEALNTGAAGFIPKTLRAKSMVNALRFMASGEIFAPARWMTETTADEAHPLAGKLTERELQVLAGICKGSSNKEIARELDLQEVTVKLHVKTLCRKLGARNRTHAAMIAKESALY